MKLNNDAGMSIVVHPSPTAAGLNPGTTFTVGTVKQSTEMHIEDVRRGMKVLCQMLENRGDNHDYTKLMHIEQFTDYLNEYRKTGKFPEGADSWFEKYHLTERHHLEDRPPHNVNLIDVLEWLVDGVVAANARGTTYQVRPLPAELIAEAVTNTANMLNSLVVRTDTNTAPSSPDRGFQFSVRNTPTEA